MGRHVGVAERERRPADGLSAAEVKHLWWFIVDGGIMAVDVRHRLWDSWGFCPRHTWAHAAVEMELAGGRPFSTAILYEDLTGRAARAVRRSRLLPWALRCRKLRARQGCLTCDYCLIARQVSEPLVAGLQSRVNRLARVRDALAATRALWEGRACPVCTGRAGMPCRPHLLAGDARAEAERLDAYLFGLQRRLYRLVRSMTWKGPAATEEDVVSWVEALGWFAGWEFPFWLAEQGRFPAPSADFRLAAVARLPEREAPSRKAGNFGLSGLLGQRVGGRWDGDGT